MFLTQRHIQILKNMKYDSDDKLKKKKKKKNLFQNTSSGKSALKKFPSYITFFLTPKYQC